MARYVHKDDTPGLIKGRELEVLQKAGIGWEAGQGGKIDCPYPNHGGEGDWRFNEKTGFCHCTCNSKHSVWDSLSMLRGEDPKAEGAYDRSKVRAAELLGKTDLIRSDDKTAGRRKKRQETPWHGFLNPELLLSAPDEKRDDSLVPKYEGKRQGVLPKDAVLPWTPHVGLKSLELFDGKKLVHTGPCAVFGLVNPNEPKKIVGAIRIYLNADGTEKADLRRPDGTEICIKPTTPGSQVGGAVLYGDPTTSPTKQAVCEGVETGGSIALGARHRGDSDVLVACGGTAEGMKNIPIIQTAKKLFIACDRDEAPNKKGNITRTGEKAGRDIAERYADRLSVHLAIPGEPGTKTDMNDVLIDDGPDAVYDCVFGAPAYEKAANQQSDADTQSDADDQADDPADEFQPTRTLALGSDVELAKAVVEDLMLQHGTVVFSEGAFWRYDKTHWKQFSNQQIRLRVHAYDGMSYPTDDGESRIRLRKSVIDSVINEMKAVATDDEFFSKPAIGINVQNGFIVIGDGDDPKPEIVPHSPDHRARHVIGGKWSQNAVKERRIGSMLTRLLSGPFKDDPEAKQKIDLIGELFGSSALGVATRIKAPKAVIFVGTTAQNGKSQILELIERLLPDDAVTSISPGNFSRQEYLIKLSGKLLNTVAELAPSSVIAGETFKKIITGDKVDAKDLYSSVVTFRPAAQHIFSTQNLPKFTSGLDRGVQRRVLVLEFNRTIPDKEQVASISRTIAESEMDLLIDFAVDGAVRLMKNGAFTEPASSKEAIARWVLQADPVLAWLQECTVTVQGKSPAKIGVSMAYQAFKQWSIDATYKQIPGLHDFSDQVVSSGRGIVKRRSSSGMQFEGLQMTKEEAFKSFGKAY